MEKISLQEMTMILEAGCNILAQGLFGDDEGTDSDVESYLDMMLMPKERPIIKHYFVEDSIDPYQASKDNRLRKLSKRRSK